MIRRTFPAFVSILVAAAIDAPAHANVLSSLVTDRDWIGYTPRNFNPNFGIEPSQAQMRADLQQLYDAGWRNLYNYTLDGNLQHIPRLAKEVGFENVLAGIFYFDEGQLAREKANSATQDPYIDGYIVGNEGLDLDFRYSLADLADAVDFFAAYGKPIGTTELAFSYFSRPALRTLGDFTFVNIQPWFNGGLNPFDPVGMAQAVRNEYVGIKSLTPDRLVAIKEAWWPTAGHPAANEEFQAAFFLALSQQTDAAGDPMRFAWGESHDQPWKNEAGPFGTLGPDWGFYEANGDPKQIVTALDDLYTSDYPVNFLPGDADRDGAIEQDDYAAWASDYGATLGIPGAQADADFDGVLTAADYTIQRDNAALASATIPEPSSAALAAAALVRIGSSRRRRG